MKRLFFNATKAASLTPLLVTWAQAQIIVLSNNPFPGDAFTNPSSSNQGQAVGSTSWYYNNVRNSGTVGIRTDFPRSGNGSAWFSLPSNTAKADLEFLANAVNLFGNFAANGFLGAFSDLSLMAYDWYRVGTSTAPNHLHPVMRVLLDLDGNLGTVTDRGGLVFERAYNPSVSPVPVDQWVSETIGANTQLWNFGAALGAWTLRTLTGWQSTYPNARIMGFDVGVGSGWNGTFQGAADLVSWTLAGNTVTYNFEVIPEPAGMLGVALALLGGAIWYRRWRA